MKTNQGWLHLLSCLCMIRHPTQKTALECPQHGWVDALAVTR